MFCCLFCVADVGVICVLYIYYTSLNLLLLLLGGLSGGEVGLWIGFVMVKF